MPARVWLLTGEKRGDNAQVRNLARAVGLPFEEKRLVMKPEWREGKPRVRPSLAPLDLTASDPLEAPWPELVITAGRRLSCAALWIKEQSAGRARFVLIGKPRRSTSGVDLSVVAAHYVVPPGTTGARAIERHDLPFMEVDDDRLRAAAADWAPRLESAARPLLGVFVGGPTGGLRFDLATTQALLGEARAAAANSGGSLFLTTSRRTPQECVDWLQRECAAAGERERLWVFEEAAPPEANPYLGLLALADHFAVTTDSVSMMVEVAGLGKPLALFPLAPDPGPGERLLERLGWVRPLDPRSDPLPAGGFAARTLHRLGWPRHSRDLSAIPRRLVETGRAVWLGEPFLPPRPTPASELPRVATRVRALVEDAADSASGPTGGV